jgi:8-hydroxy-5-deazaflavin:NADPH oxidoreductase
MRELPMTRIAILGGTGEQGGGLARRFAAAGAPVVVGSRDPGRARETVAGWGAAGRSIDVAGNAAAVEQCDVTLLAVPFTSIEGLLAELRPRFRDRSIVIDVTVPVIFAGGKMTMAEVAEGSAAEHVRARLPGGVQLAAAFKTVPAHLLAEPRASLDCDEFICGDSAEARAQAAVLVKLLPGLRPIDVGPLSRARFIEHATALAIAINRTHKVHDARFAIVGLR